MKQWTVREVMTDQVLTVAVGAPPAEIVATLTDHDVSALAVVDDFDVVIGVLTRTDVLKSLAPVEERPRRRPAWRRAAQPGVRWRRTTARQMMTAPAVTIGPGATPARAGRLMHRAGVNRLLVVDHRRHLLGIIAAADLLTLFDRPDETVRAEVEATLEPVTAGAVQVDVSAGVVLLTGRVSDRTTADVLRDLAQAVPGAADVITDLYVEPPESGRDGRRHRRTDARGVPSIVR